MLSIKAFASLLSLNPSNDTHIAGSARSTWIRESMWNVLRVVGCFATAGHVAAPMRTDITRNQFLRRSIAGTITDPDADGESSERSAGLMCRISHVGYESSRPRASLRKAYAARLNGDVEFASSASQISASAQPATFATNCPIRQCGHRRDNSVNAANSSTRSKSVMVSPLRPERDVWMTARSSVIPSRFLARGRVELS